MELKRPVYCFKDLQWDICLALLCALISWLLNDKKFQAFTGEFFTSVFFFVMLSIGWNLYKRRKGE